MTDWESSNFHRFCESNTALCQEIEGAERESTLLLMLLGVELTATVVDIALAGAAAATAAGRATTQQRLNRLTALGEHEAFTIAARGGWNRLTIIGHGPQYTELAAEIGARYFFVPNQKWDKLRIEEQAAMNLGFLKATIARRDVVVLATPVFKDNGFFAREIDYLLTKGYTWASGEMILLPPSLP